jgi:hypothetical protein
MKQPRQFDNLADREFFTVEEAVEYARRLGIPVAKGYCNKLRSVGGGAPFVRFGTHRVLYPRKSFEAWLRGRLTKPVRSTSEW